MAKDLASTIDNELCGQMGHLIGLSGIGMDQLYDLVEAIMRSFRAHDEIEYKKLENWQHQTLPKRKAVVQTTPNLSSLGFAALLC